MIIDELHERADAAEEAAAEAHERGDAAEEEQAHMEEAEQARSTAHHIEVGREGEGEASECE